MGETHQVAEPRTQREDFDCRYEGLDSQKHLESTDMASRIDQAVRGEEEEGRAGAEEKEGGKKEKRESVVGITGLYREDQRGEGSEAQELQKSEVGS